MVSVGAQTRILDRQLSPRPKRVVPVGALRSLSTGWVDVSQTISACLGQGAVPGPCLFKNTLHMGRKCNTTIVGQNSAFEALQDPERWMNQPVERRQIYTGHVIQTSKVKKDLVSKTIPK